MREKSKDGETGNNVMNQGFKEELLHLFSTGRADIILHVKAKYPTIRNLQSPKLSIAFL
jgi:hypothetical protein